MRNSDGVTITYGGVEYSEVYNVGDFRRISGYMWETIQDRAIVTMER